ncbi:hypothetical protein V7O66_13960 [Methanolobus sp. ZRKC3]|uniref:hypothetical protein n=1 Tax=Methanolobus sp. ZRKC3 TaxID=3125786 RepID=UPI003245F70E
MGLKDKYKFKIDVEIDDNGNSTMACPECGNEIDVAFENIVDENLALGESIVCPFCNQTLNQVHPPKKATEHIMDEIGKDVMDEIKKMLK